MGIGGGVVATFNVDDKALPQMPQAPPMLYNDENYMVWCVQKSQRKLHGDNNDGGANDCHFIVSINRVAGIFLRRSRSTKWL